MFKILVSFGIRNMSLTAEMNFCRKNRERIENWGFGVKIKKMGF